MAMLCTLSTRRVDSLGRPSLGALLLAALLASAGLSANLGARADGAPPSCETLRAQYRAALPAAQQCDPKAAKPCAALRPVVLGDACNCQVSVNPQRTAELDRLMAAYQALACAPEPAMAICRRMCTAPVSHCGAASGVPAACGVR